MEDKIEKAIRETIVIGNPIGLKYAVKRIMKIIETENEERQTNGKIEKVNM